MSICLYCCITTSYPPDVINLYVFQLDDDGVNEWPDVLKFLFAAVSSTLADMKECALTILTNFPGIFGDQESRYRDVIKQMLVQSLNSESTKV